MKTAMELIRPRGLSYLCIYCYEEYLRTGPLDIRVSVEMDAKIDKRSPMYIKPINFFELGDCPHCGNYYGYIEVDTEVAEIVSALNNKGYFTDFSCAGHVEEIYDGYISFHHPHPELQDYIKPIQAYRLDERKKKKFGDQPLFSECDVFFDFDYKSIRFKSLDFFPQVKQELLGIVDKFPDLTEGMSYSTSL